MKIAIFADGIYPFVVGGMQKHSYYLTKYLAQNQIYVDLYHYLPFSHLLPTTLEQFTSDELRYINNYSFHYEKSGRYIGHYIVESYIVSKKIYELFLENQQVDFVYAQGFTGWYYAKMRLKYSNLPPIGVNFHGLGMFQMAPSFKIKLEHFMFRYPVRRIISLSNYSFSLGGKLTQILETILKDKEKILTTNIGISRNWLIEADYLKKELNSRKKFVFVGRYERGKGIEELTSIVKEIINIYDIEFHFVGNIPLDMRLESDKVIYHNLIRDESSIKAIMRDIDILVSASYAEGMPTVILEAMASGSAVIATDVGAVSTMVSKENGWLINPADIVSLKESIIEAIESTDEMIYDKKIVSLREVEEKFLWERVIWNTIDSIQRVVDEKRKKEGSDTF